MARKCMVGLRFFRNYPFLRTIGKTKSERKRIKMLHEASKDQLLALVETAANVICYKTFCLSKLEMKKLSPYETFLRKLSRVKSHDKARKLILKGEGAFLPALLIPVLVEIGRALLGR